MAQEARNDAKALRLIDMLYAEGVSPENITRLLNFHFEQVFSCEHDARYRSVIKRVPDGANYAPPFTVWSQPK